MAPIFKIGRPAATTILELLFNLDTKPGRLLSGRQRDRPRDTSDACVEVGSIGRAAWRRPPWPYKVSSTTPASTTRNSAASRPRCRRAVPAMVLVRPGRLLSGLARPGGAQSQRGVLAAARGTKKVVAQAHRYRSAPTPRRATRSRSSTSPTTSAKERIHLARRL